MNDQPEPAIEHTLDECRDMGCGCREPKLMKPNPATGEWTVEEVTTPHHGKWDGIRFITDSTGRHLGSMNEQEAKAVVDAHNAALAAEREE